MDRDWAPSLAAVFLTALLWGVGYIEVPSALGAGLLILAGLVTALFCLWTRRWVAVAVGLACIAAITVFVVDVLVLERNVLLMTSRADFGRPPPTALRLLDFNVLHGYPHFPDQELRVERTVAHLAGRIESLPISIVAGDLNAPSPSPATLAFEALGYSNILPAGIDHVFLAEDSAWRVAHAEWTLRPGDVEELIGIRTELSDHPAILVDLTRDP